MRRIKNALTASIPLALGVVFLSAASQSALAGCHLNSPGGQVKHVVNIVFDNVHLRRDNPNVPSDLEQMPNLLNFIQNNGTISGNHHTPLISHTATDILTAADRRLWRPHGNSGFQRLRLLQAGRQRRLHSSFLYWTALAGRRQAADGQRSRQNRAGSLGALHPRRLRCRRLLGRQHRVREHSRRRQHRVRCDSPEGIEANNPTIRDKANADFLGIAVHCAQNSPLCANGKADLLADEPGGYDGFNALFGNVHVQPAISPSGPVKDLDGNVIKTAAGNVGLPQHLQPDRHAIARLCGDDAGGRRSGGLSLHRRRA